MEYELKPCPFCGGEARIISDIYVGKLEHLAACRYCKASSWTYESKEEAIEAWNNRKENNNV